MRRGATLCSLSMVECVGVIVCNRWFRYQYVIGRINNTLLSHFTAPDQTPFRWEVFAQGVFSCSDKNEKQRAQRAVRRAAPPHGAARRRRRPETQGRLKRATNEPVILALSSVLPYIRPECANDGVPSTRQAFVRPRCLARITIFEAKHEFGLSGGVTVKRRYAAATHDRSIELHGVCRDASRAAIVLLIAHAPTAYPAAIEAAERTPSSLARSAAA